MSDSSRTSIKVTAFLLGFISLLAQVLLLRSLLSVFSGNELILGLILALWISFTGTGSILGERLRPDRSYIGWSFVIVGLMLMVLPVSVWYVYPLFGISFGEVIPLPLTLLTNAVILLPLCLVFGAQFPLIVKSPGQSPPSITYGLESLGAFVSGLLFTLALAGLIPDRILVLSLSIVSVLTGVFLLDRTPGESRKGGSGLIGKWIHLLAGVPLLMYLILPSPGAQIIPGKIMERMESRQGEVIITNMGSQRNFYVSGKLVFSYPEPVTEEILGHIPLLFSRPGKVLIVGGSPGIIREVLRHEKAEITFLELNRTLLKLALQNLTTADTALITNSPRVEFVTDDARHYLKDSDRSFQIIILNPPYPSTASSNRYYTVEFFNLLKKRLTDGGIVLLRIMAVPGYMGEAMARANATIYNTFREVFPYREVSSMEYGLLIGAKSPLRTDLKTLPERFNQSRLKTLYLNGSVLEDIFSEFKRERFKLALEGSNDLNTDIHPVAYLHNVALWSEAHGGGMLKGILNHTRLSMILFAILFPLLLFLMGRAGRGASYPLIFSTGFLTISVVTLSLLLYQALAGYVYEMIGMISTLYMLGSAGGALVAARFPKTGRRVLLFTEGASLLFLMFFFILSSSTTGIFGGVFAVGVLGGWTFGIAAGMVERPSVLYGTDLLGAFVGALSTSIFIFPVFGLYYTMLFLVYLKALSLFSAWKL